jgi:CheY-like chemotaxis protein
MHGRHSRGTLATPPPDKNSKTEGNMGLRSGLEDERQYALWSAKRARIPVLSPRVLIAHQDKVMAESLAALLRLTGLQVMHAQNLASARSLIHNWKPQALLLDTRMDSNSGYSFIRALRLDTDIKDRLLVAISNVWPDDPIETLKAAGFDAHCRRPGATWRIAELLQGYFSIPSRG